MGGTNSGPKASRTIGWEIIEQFEDVLLRMEREKFDDEVTVSDDWIKDRRADLNALKERYKTAIERERTK